MRSRPTWQTFQVSNFESLVGLDDWSKFESRVERNGGGILEILAEHKISATFFVLGWEAERCPALLRKTSKEEGRWVYSATWNRRVKTEILA